VTGSIDTVLVVIRGNSGAGKSTVARRLRDAYGRGCALVEQDYLRRVVLRERDLPGGLAPVLIDRTARVALDHGYHVILEGILHTARYAGPLRGLLRDHVGRNAVFYLDVSLDETLRRHATRPHDFGPDDLRSWYAEHDVLGVDGEHVLPQTLTLEETVDLIARSAGLTLSGRDDDVLPLASARSDPRRSRTSGPAAPAAGAPAEPSAPRTGGAGATR